MFRHTTRAIIRESPRYDNHEDSWFWHMWFAATRCRIYNVWRIHSVHVKLVLQTKLVIIQFTIHTILKHCQYLQNTTTTQITLVK